MFLIWRHLFYIIAALLHSTTGTSTGKSDTNMMIKKTFKHENFLHSNTQSTYSESKSKISYIKTNQPIPADFQKTTLYIESSIAQPKIIKNFTKAKSSPHTDHPYQSFSENQLENATNIFGSSTVSGINRKYESNKTTHKVKIETEIYELIKNTIGSLETDTQKNISDPEINKTYSAEPHTNSIFETMLNSITENEAKQEYIRKNTLGLKIIREMTSNAQRKNTESTQKNGRRQYFPQHRQHSGAQYQYPGSQGQYSGAQKSIQKDPKIERLLAQYRGLVNKYGPDYLNGEYTEQKFPPSNPHQNPTLMRQNYAAHQYSGQEKYGIPTGEGNQSVRYNQYWGPHTEQTYAPHNIWIPLKGAVRQDPIGPTTEPLPTTPEPFTTTEATKHNPKNSAANRFTTRMSTTRRRRRTTPHRISLSEDCDYLAYYCLKAYDTGFVCGRTLYFNHYTFQNYCMLDYVNCMERYDIWQIAHMGECFDLKILTEYLHYPYNDDYFLDNYYIVEDM